MISYSCFATLMRRFKNKRFINTRTIQLSSDSLMDACLYGDVAQWLERGKLINLRGRGFESFHLHDYIATPYSSKTRSSNIWKVGLLWHHGRVWFIANGLNPFVSQGTGGSNPPDVVSFSRRTYIIPVPYHRLKGRFYNAGDSADVLTSLISCVWVGLTPTPAPSISPFASLPSVFYSLWR